MGICDVGPDRDQRAIAHPNRNRLARVAWFFARCAFDFVKYGKSVLTDLEDNAMYEGVRVVGADRIGFSRPIPQAPFVETQGVGGQGRVAQF